MHEETQGKRKGKFKKRVNSLPRRRIEPHTDVTRGVSYEPTPEPLRSLVIDGYINFAKFRLILAIMSNDPGFQISRQYLEWRFGPNTLKRYLPELVSQKIVEVEEVCLISEKFPRGQIHHVYHVNSVAKWDLPEFREFALDNPIRGAWIAKMIRAIDTYPALDGHPTNEQPTNEHPTH